MTDGEEMGAVEAAAVEERVREGVVMGLKAEEPTAHRGTAGETEWDWEDDAPTAIGEEAVTAGAVVVAALKGARLTRTWWRGLGNFGRWCWGRLPGQDTGRRFSGGGRGDVGSEMSPSASCSASSRSSSSSSSSSLSSVDCRGSLIKVLLSWWWWLEGCCCCVVAGWRSLSSRYIQ